MKPFRLTTSDRAYLGSSGRSRFCRKAISAGGRMSLGQLGESRAMEESSRRTSCDRAWKLSVSFGSLNPRKLPIKAPADLAVTTSVQPTKEGQCR